MGGRSMSGPGPGGATMRVNGEPVPFREVRIVDLLHGRGIDPRAPGIAVAVNGEIVRRERWSLDRLSPGDEVEIVRAVQGG
jgi:sulfur carrier protein